MFDSCPTCAQELIDHVVAVAENTADELARSDGREVQLEEDPDLQLPFLLPEDGYSCDVVRSLPNGLQDFLEPLLQRGEERASDTAVDEPFGSGVTLNFNGYQTGRSRTRCLSVWGGPDDEGRRAGCGLQAVVCPRLV